MPANADYTREYFEILASLQGDVEGRRAAFAYMQQSSAIVHHEVVASTFIPRLFNAETYRFMKRTAETIHRILCKVIDRYLTDPAYRRAFAFDPRLEELICLPRGYDSLLPFARVDTFIDEERLSVKFCEFNADGSSGMNEDREVAASIASSASFKEFARRHHVEGCELFESWIRAFLDVYAGYERRVENPRFAICDYLENGVVDEFYLYARLFQERGTPCVVADVRELSFDGEVLRDGDGQRIDAVWRRCVTNDVLANWEVSQQLINAVRAEKVALIGSFAGHIVHDKQLFKVLFDKRTLAFLDDDEISFIEETVPTTTFLDSDHLDLRQLRQNKDEWIIKPTDHYGADQVFAGCFASQQEWEGLLARYANAGAGFPFLAQRYIRPYKTETLPPDGVEGVFCAETAADLSPRMYNNMNGLYLYQGIFTGVFSRLGPFPTISKDMQGVTAATVWVDDGERPRSDERPPEQGGAGPALRGRAEGPQG